MEKNNTPTWEFKDRTYVIKGANQPPLVSIQAKHSNKKPLLWFDQEKGYNRELRYATNQKSPFVDEQEGYATLGHIYFRNGSLTVPKEKQALQKLLSLYHPKKDSTYAELTPIKDAENEVDIIELQIEALNLAKGLDIEELEAILRVNYGNKVSKMSTKELKRDGLIYARNNPALFLELASDDNRKFLWTNGRKLFTVPFEENPYSALAAWFKTDDGMEVLKSVEKKLK